MVGDSGSARAYPRSCRYANLGSQRLGQLRLDCGDGGRVTASLTRCCECLQRPLVARKGVEQADAQVLVDEPPLALQGSGIAGRLVHELGARLARCREGGPEPEIELVDQIVERRIRRGCARQHAVAREAVVGAPQLVGECHGGAAEGVDCDAVVRLDNAYRPVEARPRLELIPGRVPSENVRRNLELQVDGVPPLSLAGQRNHDGPLDAGGVVHLESAGQPPRPRARQPMLRPPTVCFSILRSSSTRHTAVTIRLCHDGGFTQELSCIWEHVVEREGFRLASQMNLPRPSLKARRETGKPQPLTCCRGRRCLSIKRCGVSSSRQPC